jgi:hypothetical protein
VIVFACEREPVSLRRILKILQKNGNDGIQGTTKEKLSGPPTYCTGWHCSCRCNINDQSLLVDRFRNCRCRRIRTWNRHRHRRLESSRRTGSPTRNARHLAIERNHPRCPYGSSWIVGFRYRHLALHLRNKPLSSLQAACRSNYFDSRSSWVRGLCCVS